MQRWNAVCTNGSGAKTSELMEMSRDKSSWCTCRRLAAGSEKQRMAVFPLSTLVKELTNWDRLKTDRADYGFFKRECHSFHAMLLQREFTPRLSPIISWKGVLLSEHCVSCLRWLIPIYPDCWWKQTLITQVLEITKANVQIDDPIFTQFSWNGPPQGVSGEM